MICRPTPQVIMVRQGTTYYRDPNLNRNWTLQDWPVGLGLAEGAIDLNGLGKEDIGRDMDRPLPPIDH